MPRPRRRRALGAAGAAKGDLRAELAAVDDMLAIAERHASPARRPGALAGGLDQAQPARRAEPGTAAVSSSSPNTRIRAAGWSGGCARRLTDTDRADDRIGVFTGATGSDRSAKRSSAPSTPTRTIEPLRILHLHRRRPRGHQSPDLLLRPRSISTCRGIPPGSNSATAASIASSSRRSRSSAATSATSSARPTSCLMRWCGRPRPSASSSAPSAR